MDENLVKPHPRDEVLIAAQKMRDKQKADRLEKIRADLEITREAKEIGKAEELRKEKHRMERNYEDVFIILIEKYLGINIFNIRDYLGSLSPIQMKELDEYIYERAKKFFWPKTILYVALGLVIPIFGWMWLLEAFDKKHEDLSYYKFVSMRDWYRKEFGQITGYDPSSGLIKSFND